MSLHNAASLQCNLRHHLFTSFICTINIKFYRRIRSCTYTLIPVVARVPCLHFPSILTSLHQLYGEAHRRASHPYTHSHPKPSPPTAACRWAPPYTSLITPSLPMIYGDMMILYDANPHAMYCSEHSKIQPSRKKP